MSYKSSLIYIYAWSPKKDGENRKLSASYVANVGIPIIEYYNRDSGKMEVAFKDLKPQDKEVKCSKSTHERMEKFIPAIKEILKNIIVV